MATEVKRAICTAEYWTANQSAMESLYGVGNYYTSVSAFLAGEVRNLVSADEVAIAECYNCWATGLNDSCLVSASWTTDSTRYIKITVAPDNRHDGTPGSGFYCNCTTSVAEFFKTYVNYTVLEYIEAEGNFSSALYFLYYSNNTVDSCIFHDASAASVAKAYSNGGAAISNSLFYNLGTSRYTSTDVTYVEFDKCTFYQASSTDSLMLRIGTYTDCFAYCGTSLGNGVFYSTCTGDYNAASDASSPGSNSLDNRTTSDFVDYASDDFRTAAGSNLATAGSVDFIGFLLEESSLLPINLILSDGKINSKIFDSNVIRG